MTINLSLCVAESSGDFVPAGSVGTFNDYICVALLVKDLDPSEVISRSNIISFLLLYYYRHFPVIPHRVAI